MLLRQHNDFDKTFFIFSSPIFIISNHLHIAVFAPFLTTHFPNQAAANDSWSTLRARKICHFHKFSQFYLPEATKSAVYNAMLDHLNQILMNDLDFDLDLEEQENEVNFFPFLCGLIFKTCYFSCSFGLFSLPVVSMVQNMTSWMMKMF